MKNRTKSGSPVSRWLICAAIALLATTSARAASQWEQLAEQLAEKIASVMGPGQARLVINNRSTIAAAQLPSIRRLIEQDLHAHGINLSGEKSTNQIGVTLSENSRETLWVAEIMEGNQTHVSMVHGDREAVAASTADAGIVLEKKRIWNSLSTVAPHQAQGGAVLAALQTKPSLVILDREEIIIFVTAPDGWREEKRFALGGKRATSRDAHGLLIATADGYGFMAYTAGIECRGNYTKEDSASVNGDWTVRCRESDDPWQIALDTLPADSPGLKAFYNSGRNFFTGVITPSPGVEMPPFYSIAQFPRATADHAALLFNGIDGKVQLAEAGGLKAVSGTRDWGSDFVALRTGCGAGTQVIASSSGEAAKDSLRAYDITRQEAIAASAPLEMGGEVTALWTAPGGTSALAVVRKSTVEYEVDRVTALCP